jgi:nicotinamide-nucleotide adenylyltransferase
MASQKPQTAAILGRWQPVHSGHQAVLQSLCERFSQVVIGIGSANIDDYRSPFDLPAVMTMLRRALDGYENYTLVPVPDMPDDDEWTRTALGLLGRADLFYTANPYVRSLLDGRFVLAHPVEAVPPARRTPVSGTRVRRELARGDGWIPLVPPAVADYIRQNSLDVNFRTRYGLHTLVMETIVIN